MILLAQVIELITACAWQAAFPYGGVAGFVSNHKGSASAMTPRSADDSGRGSLGLAVAASLGQAALYTALFVFFGCDRVVLSAVRVTGWEHGAAAAWALMRAAGMLGGGGKLCHVVACAWLTVMTFLCGYFGRQL